MTDPRRQRFAKYARKLADMMGLKDWTVEIGDDPPSSEDALASVCLPYGRKFAIMRLSDVFLDYEPAAQRHAIVHELTHLHVEPPWAFAIDGMPDTKTSAMRMLCEYSVDAIAVAWAPLLPLPNARRS